jgi:hypothetical protein
MTHPFGSLFPAQYHDRSSPWSCRLIQSSNIPARYLSASLKVVAESQQEKRLIETNAGMNNVLDGHLNKGTYFRRSTSRKVIEKCCSKHQLLQINPFHLSLYCQFYEAIFRDNSSNHRLLICILPPKRCTTIAICCTSTVTDLDDSEEEHPKPR